MADACAVHFLDWRGAAPICEVAITPRACPVPNNQPKELKTMTVYMIADIKVTDDKWIPDYAANVHELVHKHGGKYLARSGNVKTLEGKPLETTLIAILKFPSAAAVKAFLADPKYARYAAARQKGSDSRFQLIDNTDLAGTISYLAKAA